MTKRQVDLGLGVCHSSPDGSGFGPGVLAVRPEVKKSDKASHCSSTRFVAFSRLSHHVVAGLISWCCTAYSELGSPEELHVFWGCVQSGKRHHAEIAPSHQAACWQRLRHKGGPHGRGSAERKHLAAWPSHMLAQSCACPASHCSHHWPEPPHCPRRFRLLRTGAPMIERC